MNRINLAYGNSTLTVSLPKRDVMLLTERQPSSARASEEALIRRALEVPYGMARLSRLVRRGQRVAIVVSDITLPYRSPAPASPVRACTSGRV